MIAPISRVISQDTTISRVLSTLPKDSTIKISLSGVTGVLMDESTYDGLLETIRILQENPTIIQSLEERENGEFLDEEDILKYV